MKKLCIYHGNCADGFGAAWAVRHAFGDDVEFHAGIYQQSPPDVTDRDVIIVDFSYKYDVLVKMSYKANSILILDHHKSAAADLEKLPKVIENTGYGGFHSELSSLCASQNMPHIGALFDMERSGVMITWNFFHPDVWPPALIRHIQDRDLWKFELDGTREIQAALFSHPYDFEVWDALMHINPEFLRTDGVAIERKHHKDIAEFIKTAVLRMDIAGHDVPVLNAPYMWSSDAGHIMAQGEPFAACYWDTPDGRVFSLRSAENGLDVSEIAKQFGGGGHKNAAGFKVPVNIGSPSPLVTD